MPLASLLFLVPFIVLYEVGTRCFAFDPAHQTERRIIAFNLMHQFFQWCGATGKYMPPLAVIAILLAVHIARNDPWRVKSGTLLGMAAESAAWALPLLAMGTLAARYLYHHLPLLTGVSLPILLAQFRATGIQSLASSSRESSENDQPLLTPWQVDWCRPVALLIGNEGSGLPEEIERSADARIRIPMSSSVESLNAAAAAAVLFYEAARQRSSRC